MSINSEQDYEVLYRYRPLKSILEYNEINNQEVYFSRMEDLNDPMEGYFMPFYKGDTDHWSRFFDEYFVETLNDYLSKRNKDVYISMDKLINIRKGFLESDDIKRLVDRLSKIKTHITGYNFRHFMQYFVHPFTFFYVGSFVEKELRYVDCGNIDDLKDKAHRVLSEILDSNLIENIIFFLDSDEKISELNYVIAEWRKFTYEGIYIDVRIPRISSINRIISNIEKRYRANYISASYTTHKDNASMWSHYANVQNGVCLGFRVYNDSTGKYALFDIPDGRLYFSKMNYTKSLLCEDTAFDLFKLMDVAYCNVDVQKQVIKEQKSLYCYKMDDWAYEDEYRLLLLESLSGRQKLKYSMTELREVIFGYNVDTMDRIRIINDVKEKCKTLPKNFIDVKFYEIILGKMAPVVNFIYELS